MAAKKKVTKKSKEDAIAALGEKVTRLRKKIAKAADGVAKRLARKKVKRTQRKKRSVASAGQPKKKKSS